MPTENENREQAPQPQAQQQPRRERSGTMIPLSTYEARRQKAYERGRSEAAEALLREAGVASIEELRALRKPQPAVQQQAAPQSAAQEAAAQEKPPKPGESQEQWEKRIASIEEKYEQRFAQMSEELEAQKAWRAEREEAEEARAAEAAWEEFRAEAKGKGITGKRLQLVEAHAQRVLAAASEEERAILDEDFEAGFWKPLMEDEDLRSVFFPGEAAGQAPAQAQQEARRPANSGATPKQAAPTVKDVQDGVKKTPNLVDASTRDVDDAWNKLSRTARQRAQ